MANRWLLKTEPGEYSFDDLVRDKGTVWDGVRNPLALRYLRMIRKRDELFIYHTGIARAVVGVARAVSDPYPDPAQRDSRLVVVDVVPGRRLVRAVPLEAMRADRAFRGFELLRISRLSIMPVPAPLCARILRLAEG